MSISKRFSMLEIKEMVKKCCFYNHIGKCAYRNTCFAYSYDDNNKPCMWFYQGVLPDIVVKEKDSRKRRKEQSMYKNKNLKRMKNND